jgi:hypothetical protein
MARSANMDITEFTVDAAGEKLTCWLASPERSRRSEKSGLLLNISATRHYALRDPSQNHPTQPFLDAGHYVLSFDLPHHGDHVREEYAGHAAADAANGQIQAMSKAFTAGDDPFEQFIADGKAAFDACLDRGIGANGKIVAYGVSRAAYCCLRLAAADPRLRAVAGPSPVTDWAVLPEFARYSDEAKTAQLHIANWAGRLSETAVYLCIGSQDDVVSTRSCVDFAMKLFDEQRQALPEGALLNQLHIVDSHSHSPAQYWRLDATRYLLDFCE